MQLQCIQLATVEDVATRFDVSVGTVNRWVREGIIPCIRPSRRIVPQDRLAWRDRENVCRSLDVHKMVAVPLRRIGSADIFFWGHFSWLCCKCLSHRMLCAASR